ncbi:transcriptional regulator, TetR family [Pseudonocardia thermophila]|uniref:Transcriptional regulator, TetR family n=1 Tax=Pseudonocardia thermophila TaxID=1848 RepID=A0A1M6Y0X3_PSETH|nr:TetR/AcrR family transcriptional regulator [Pseudonocardia thermophila]SHL11763.1 transcriptional regulator, TetR family [Pseudonocardia thermophila]
MGVTGKLRRDSQAVRDRLLDAATELVAERGLHFSLPELARLAGVGTATVYRHFADVAEVGEKLFARILGGLLDRLEAIATEPGSARERMSRVCLTWVEAAAAWAPAAARLRRPEGVLERRAAGDPLIVRLFDVLGTVMDALIEEGEVPDQGRDYALLVWITLFDERVFVDLRASTNWSNSQIASMLEASVLGALRNRPL